MVSPSVESLPKSARIRKRADYLSVQGRGRKLQSDNFLVFVLPRADAPLPTGARFGTTVTKKVGSAVVRNRVKRLVREVYRRRKSWFPAGSDIVFVAKKSAANLELGEVELELKRIAARALGSR